MTLYTINDLSLMTGLTTRTLRTYIKLGVLRGEKQDGAWRFTEDDFARFLADTGVRRSLRARRSGDVLDFLADTAKRASETCVVLDCAVSDEESEEIAAFFCARVDGSGVRFSYQRDRGMSRVILIGGEREVAALMREYYERGG